MPYTPLIHPDAIGSQANPFARSPAINDLLSRCYGSDILPARGKHLRFRRTEIFGDLYLSERSWVDEVDFATPDGFDRHEGYLDHLFAKHGNLTVLHHFRNRDGYYPWGRLLIGLDGNLYGTTYLGGATGHGTVFTLATDGSGFADLHDFDPNFGHDGYGPFAGLVQDAAGTLYGATIYGGPNGIGTFFKLNTNGTGYSLVHSLTYAEGAGPQGTPVLSGGILYAVCVNGGSSGTGSLVSVATATGTTTNLHSFNYSTDGGNPLGDLFLGADGNLYDTNYNGGPSSGNGTAWKATIAGTVTVLQTFNAATGRYPYGGLVVGAGGIVYGTTYQDGPNGGGTLFSIP